MQSLAIVVCFLLLGVAICIFAVNDLDPRVTMYLYWLFVAASLVKFPEPVAVPELKPLSELKLHWRGHLL